MSVWEFFWPLCDGRRRGAGRARRPPRPGLPGRTRRPSSGVTTLHFVPSMLEAFLAVGRGRPATRRGPRRCAGCSAAARRCPPPRPRRWHALTGVPLHNLYGPTEAAVDVTYHGVRRRRRRRRASRSAARCGTPRLHVLDAGLRPVPDGVPGELYLAGVQLARGYHGRPALTAERFVADPFGAPASGCTAPATWCAADADGALEYLGRTDHQVKIRGNRIELGEIEAALARACPRWRTGRGDRPRATGAAGRLRRAAPAAAGRGRAARCAPRSPPRCPAPMVPAAVVLLDDLPLTPSGKLDRAALPAPQAPAAEPGARAAPRSASGCCARDVRRRARSSPRSAPTTTSSPSAATASPRSRVASRARRAGLDVGPRDVFAHRTPAGLAAAARRRRRPPRARAGRPAGASRRSRARAGRAGAARCRWPRSGRCRRCRRACSSTPPSTTAALDVYTVQEAFDLDHPARRRPAARAPARALLARNPEPARRVHQRRAARPVQFVVGEPATAGRRGRPVRRCPRPSGTRRLERADGGRPGPPVRPGPPAAVPAAAGPARRRPRPARARPAPAAVGRLVGVAGARRSCSPCTRATATPRPAGPAPTATTWPGSPRRTTEASAAAPGAPRSPGSTSRRSSHPAARPAPRPRRSSLDAELPAGHGAAAARRRPRARPAPLNTVLTTALGPRARRGHRPHRRRVRHDGRRPPGRGAGRREHHRPVPQHRPRPDARSPRPSRSWTCCGACRASAWR